jgi:SanA protein
LLLILGDVIILFSLAFFRWFIAPPGSSFTAGLLVALLPYLFTWLVAATVLGIFSARSRLLPFLGWSLLTWLITWLVAEVVQAAAKILFFQVFPLPAAIFIRFIEGALVLTVWRLVYWIFCAAIFQARLPFLRTLAKFSLFFIVAGGFIACLPRWVAGAKHTADIFPAATIPNRPAALVFSAGLWSSGEPSTVLKDRVDTAADLYKAGKVGKLILSGNGQSAHGDETQVMRKLALARGVPDEAIIMDERGLSTYDSCYRAQAVYHINQAILVSQRYHLARALFLCHALGVDSLGVPADRSAYSPQSLIWWTLREYPASLADVVDLFRGYRPMP